MSLSLFYTDHCWWQSYQTGFDEVFSEEHVFLSGALLCCVSIFGKSGSGQVVSTRECSKSPNLHYCGSKQHNGVCSFHPSNGTQAPFLLLSIFLCLLERRFTNTTLWNVSFGKRVWGILHGNRRHTYSTSTSCGDCQRCTEISIQISGWSISLRHSLYRKLRREMLALTTCPYGSKLSTTNEAVLASCPR